MGRRSDVDWEAIERDYRLGNLTNTELAQRHGVGRGSLLRKAKKEGWTRDLSAEVRARTRAALIGNESRGVADSSRPASDVDRVVATNVEVIERHRQMLAKGAEVTAKILAELDEATEHREEIEEAIEEETAGDRSGKRRQMMLKAVSVASRASALNAISNAVRNFIAAERRSFNLDEPGEGGGDDTPLEKLRKEISGQSFRPADAA
jgi:hypothetical protein